MRVCTRDASGATYDAAVPVKPLFHNSSVLPTFEGSEEMCSETPFDVPWSMEDAAAAENPAAQFSLGCVPMWDGSPVDMNPVYPSDAYTAQLDNTDPGTFPFQPYTLFIHTELITHEKQARPETPTGAAAWATSSSCNVHPTRTAIPLSQRPYLCGACTACVWSTLASCRPYHGPLLQQSMRPHRATRTETATQAEATTLTTTRRSCAPETAGMTQSCQLHASSLCTDGISPKKQMRRGCFTG